MAYILHIDLNAFFASVEAIDNPSIKYIPFAVGGRTSRSVVSSANYIARKYGIKAGMSIFQAKRLCPQILFVPAHYHRYEEYSTRFFNLLKQKVTNRIEQFSIDECYLDVSGLCNTTDDAIKLAQNISKMVQQNLKLTVSIGVSYNKFLAKMASDLKKPNGITPIFSQEDIQTKIWPLPIDNIIFLGQSSCKTLKKYGIKIIQDIANPKNNEILKNVLNKNWYLHFLHANGIDPDPVDSSVNQPKSISASHTFLNDTSSYDEITLMIKSLTKEITDKLGIEQLGGKTFSVSIKDPQFKITSKSVSIKHNYHTYDEILPIFINLYDLYFTKKEIRLVGVGISNLTPINQKLGGLFAINDNHNPHQKTLDDVIQEINKKFAVDIIDYADKRID